MKDRDVSKHGRRDDRLIRERVHDPYKTRLKLTDPAVCPDCGAVYLSDRWTWEPAPAGAEETRCQAC
ncbi:MAG: ATPase, partial [Alphaproteobacteria bacterium]|nr:ATPase [Alphaproteobacteria bacterium]